MHHDSAFSCAAGNELSKHFGRLGKCDRPPACYQLSLAAQCSVPDDARLTWDPPHCELCWEQR